MDFEEFLIANGVGELALVEILSSITWFPSEVRRPISAICTNAMRRNTKKTPTGSSRYSASMT